MDLSSLKHSFGIRFANFRRRLVTVTSEANRKAIREFFEKAEGMSAEERAGNLEKFKEVRLLIISVLLLSSQNFLTSITLYAVSFPRKSGVP